MTGTEALLAVQDVHQQFGALKVLTGVTLAVPRGQAVGVVGPNGAGKSTLLDIVAGGRRPDSGRIYLGGADVTAVPAGRRTRLGLGRTYQVPRPFPALTVFENALVAAGPGCGAMPRTRWPRASVFNINYSADMLFMVVIGGLGTIEGPLIGALILFAAQQVFSQYGAWYLVGIGALAIAVVLLAPAGLWGNTCGRRGWSLLPVGYRVRSPRRSP